ncbi:hypothetical protein SADUNF_Sadunf10G0144500 [Salix dunnii]|uniref:Uncharacterized protein n=1 Tax=Salix dunnii TaxID=1413687 RepID=A0A835JS70_9ROSI|nr:hypothetical protein SADUNF_Sadunf10G0144500 [Salix dunnii]
MRHDRAPEEEEFRKDLILVRSCCVGCEEWRLFYTWHGTAVGIKQIRDARGALQNCICFPCGHGVELLESLLSTPAQEGMFDHQSHPFLTCHTHELQSGAELVLEQLMETQTPHPKQHLQAVARLS